MTVLSLLMLNAAHAGITLKDPVLPITALTFNGSALTSSDNASTWPTYSITTNPNINLTDVTWANNQFVALGYDSYYLNAIAYTSPDGSQWSPGVYLSGYLGRVIYANHTYFATGNNGALFASTDGAHWTSSPAPSPCGNSNIFGIAWGNGVYVLTGLCMGGSEQFFTATSTDALNWNVNVMPGSISFTDVIWQQNQFVAVGNLGAIETSPDGVNWTQRFSDNPLNLERIVYGNNMYVAVGNENVYPNNLAVIVTSTDGINWKEMQFKPNNPHVIEGLAFKNNQFILAVQNMAKDTNVLFTSPDGVNWTMRTSAGDTIINAIG